MSARISVVSASIEDPEDIIEVRRNAPRPHAFGDGVHFEGFQVHAGTLQLFLRRESAEALIAGLRAALDEPASEEPVVDDPAPTDDEDGTGPEPLAAEGEQPHDGSDRTGSVIARGKARPAWQYTFRPGGVMYDRGDGLLVTAGPAVHDTYASRGSETDIARQLG